jgi:heme b synthase
LADTSASPNTILEPKLRLVAWEITRRCNLACAHCRAGSLDAKYRNELSTDECFKLIDQIAEVGKPILILTGGEPLSHPDVFTIGRYAVERGLRVVLGSNGTQIDDEVAAKLKQVPISRVGVSIDFPVARLQDEFRGKAGAFDTAIAGIRRVQRAGIDVQINSTVTKKNVEYLNDLLGLALDLGAVAFHPFMLVPTGRGKQLADVMLFPEEYERTLNWVYDKQAELGNRILFKPTDAPHYMRIVLERGGGQARSAGGGHHALDAFTRGCLAGTGFCFVSHVGRVQGCGYLDVEAGNVRKQSFKSIWNGSEVFNRLRDLSQLKGKCGACEYKRACGGCRARAYESTGDYMAQEPYCIYEPLATRSGARKGQGSI